MNGWTGMAEWCTCVWSSYGPRLIDVDVLFYGDEVVTTDTADGPLVVPHERLHERDFVLAPFCDLAPGALLSAFRVDVRTAGLCASNA